MKKFLFLLLVIPSLVLAGGSSFSHKDTFLQQEFDNVYQKIDNLQAAKILTTNTSGQILVGQGNGVNPTFVSSTTYCGGIIQSTQTIVSTSSGTSATSFAATNTLVTFAPKLTTSMINVYFTGSLTDSNVATASCLLTLFRDNTNLAPSSGAFGIINSGATGSLQNTIPLSYQETSPGTSSVSYVIRIRANGAGITCTLNSNTAGILRAEEIYVCQ